MFIGAYLCTGVICLALGAWLLVGMGSQTADSHDPTLAWRRYFLLSITAMSSALVLFIVLSSALGIFGVGRAGSWSYPQDYLTAGPIAWLAMLLPAIGILAPIWIGVLVRTRPLETDELSRGT